MWFSVGKIPKIIEFSVGFEVLEEVDVKGPAIWDVNDLRFSQYWGGEGC
jgi:hypothetical protein